MTWLSIAAGAAFAVFALREVLLIMRNRRGLYDWPIPVQALICIADGIPLRFVNAFPSQQASADAFWAAANISELTPSGIERRKAARKRMGLD